MLKNFPQDVKKKSTGMYESNFIEGLSKIWFKNIDSTNTFSN